MAFTGRVAACVGTVIVALALYLDARRWARLAHRSRVGASSEDVVRRTLARLERDGWRVRHSVSWPGGGDIDHVVVAPAPARVAFAIETKTKTYRAQHVARVSQMARWISRRRWVSRTGAVPVVCVVHGTRVCHTEGEVLIVSADRLVSTLRIAASERSRG